MLRGVSSTALVGPLGHLFSWAPRLGSVWEVSCELASRGDRLVPIWCGAACTA